MKPYASAAIIMAAICLSVSGNAQTEQETKNFITNFLENKCTQVHSIEFSPQSIDKDVYGESVKESDNKYFMFVKSMMRQPGISDIYMFSAFDVRGISSINIVRETEGAIYCLNIKIKKGFSFKNRQKITYANNRTLSDTQFKDSKVHPSYDLQIDVNFEKDDCEQLKKAIIHLCKLYGGSPIDDNLFK